MMATTVDAAVESRARQSLGASNDAIRAMVARAVASHGKPGGRLVDVGCGRGDLWPDVRSFVGSYCGMDAVRYDAFPAAADFVHVDLDAASWPLPAGSADMVTAVETIEHLENPWAFLRQLAAIAKVGGLVVVTTPNQLSVLSLLTLAGKGRFSAFQDAHYPAHRTALLASDLRRAASAGGLHVLEVVYSGRGRVPLTPWHYPAAISRRTPRWCSDNLMIVGRKVR
jgi:2-polyprenyl-3-methyl-5-hydroxy-6-metoxy-1,4-benzoquinol methylase